MLPWDEVRFFLEVCRAGTLAGAARRLGVDETTVGRRMAKLERALEARLTSRTPDGLVLTAAGDAALRSAEEMERAALALERSALGSDRKAAGRVRVAAPGILGNYFVLPVLHEIVAEHPEITIDFLTSMARVDARREADIAIRTIRPREPGLAHRRLGRYAVAPYVRAEAHPGPGSPPAAVVAFTDAMRPPFRPITERFPAARVALRTSSMETLIEATRRGIGAGDLPCFYADADPQLARLSPDEPPQLMDVWLVVQQEVQRTARVRVIIRALSDRFSRLASRLEGVPAAVNREPQRAGPDETGRAPVGRGARE